LERLATIGSLLDGRACGARGESGNGGRSTQLPRSQRSLAAAAILSRGRRRRSQRHRQVYPSRSLGAGSRCTGPAQRRDPQASVRRCPRNAAAGERLYAASIAPRLSGTVPAGGRCTRRKLFGDHRGDIAKTGGPAVLCRGCRGGRCPVSRSLARGCGGSDGSALARTVPRGLGRVSRSPRPNSSSRMSGQWIGFASTRVPARRSVCQRHAALSLLIETASLAFRIATSRLPGRNTRLSRSCSRFRRGMPA